MLRLIKEFKPEQLIWYGQLLVKMVIVDQNFSPSELQFVKEVLAQIPDEKERKSLVGYLEKQQEPPLRQPKSLNKEVLAQVFIQLIHVALADNELHAAELALLKSLSRLFDFHPNYLKDCLAWAQDGIYIRRLQQKLAKRTLSLRNELVPVKKLNTEQKKWYIDAVVAALIHEGLKEEKELNLLKRMFASTESREEQILLRNHILLQHRPPIRRPPPMPEGLTLLILMEVALIGARNGDMSYQSSQHLRLLADVSRLSAKSYNELMEWINQSVLWKKRERDLLNQVRLNSSEEEEEAKKQGRLITHPDNNSIQVRKVQCFVCGSGKDLPLFQLRHLSQKTSQNIFGTPIFLGANEGFDPIDFNRIKVVVCPACLFASPKKEHFIRQKKDQTPEELSDPRFKGEWIRQVLEREEQIEPYKKQISTIQRSLPAAIACYDLAIDAVRHYHAHLPKESNQGQLINLYLTLAELKMQAGLREEAENDLRLAMDLAKQIYLKGRAPQLVLRCARLLLISALYFEDEKNIGEYMNFFHRYKTDKAEGFKLQDRQEFMKLYQEVSGIFSQRERYKKSALKGFKLL